MCVRDGSEFGKFFIIFFGRFSSVFLFVFAFTLQPMKETHHSHLMVDASMFGNNKLRDIFCFSRWQISF
jgi:ATP/ADP translocase